MTKRKTLNSSNCNVFVINYSVVLLLVHDYEYLWQSYILQQHTFSPYTSSFASFFFIWWLSAGVVFPLLFHLNTTWHIDMELTMTVPMPMPMPCCVSIYIKIWKYLCHNLFVQCEYARRAHTLTRSLAHCMRYQFTWSNWLIDSLLTLWAQFSLSFFMWKRVFAFSSFSTSHIIFIIIIIITATDKDVNGEEERFWAKAITHLMMMMVFSFYISTTFCFRP